MRSTMERLLARLAQLARALTPQTAQQPAQPPLEILRFDEEQLLIRGCDGVLCFERRRRVVKKAGRVVASFEAISQVRLAHHRGGDDHPAYWSVDLHVKGWFADVRVGSSEYDVDASIAAARIATVVGKPVKAW